jgi:hypothetical protein
VCRACGTRARGACTDGRFVQSRDFFRRNAALATECGDPLPGFRRRGLKRHGNPRVRWERSQMRRIPREQRAGRRPASATRIRASRGLFQPAPRPDGASRR